MAALGGGSRLKRRDWSNLPLDILEFISSKCTNIVDYIRFRVVCKPWRAATNPTSPNLRKPLLPWLLLPYNINRDARRFFNISSKKVYTFHLPESVNHVLWGTPHGWLIMVDVSYSVSLLNPLTRALIRLPQIDSSYLRFYYDGTEAFVLLLKYFRCRTFMSEDDECIVVVTHKGLSRQFLYWKVGDTGWTVLHTGNWHGTEAGIEAIAYHGHRFYAMAHGYKHPDSRHVIVWDINSQQKVGKIVPSLRRTFTDSCLQMVTSYGKLLLLALPRYICTNPVRLYKLLETNGKLNWSRSVGIDATGDRMLLCGFNREVLMMTTQGGTSQCWENLVYLPISYTWRGYWNQYRVQGHRIYETNMVNKAEKLLLSYSSDVAPFYFQPSWFTPTLRP